VDALTRAAIAGTSHEAPPAGGLPTDDLLEGARRSPERDLLLRAGMHAVYRTAGRRTKTGVEGPQPAPQETLPACSAKAAEVVRQLLTGRRQEILREALERLRLGGLRLPPALLPDALDVQQPELRPAVAAVLGERGRWLAGLNPSWEWVIGGSEQDDETAWEEGPLTDRLAALRHVRRSDRSRGLAWVEEVWKSEKADTRVEVVAALEAGLSSADEPFLERALDDRSVRVRQAAVALLARLPDSAYAQRVTARAGAVLADYEPPAKGLLQRCRTGRFVVEPPEDVDGGWRRDLPGVDNAPQGIGEKTWAISCTLAVVPLDHWEHRFGASPEDLIAAAKGNDWEPAVLAGWCRAGALHGDRGWAMFLWGRCHGLADDSEGRQVWSAAQELAPVVPQDWLARALPELLQGRSIQMSGRLASTLQEMPAVWMPELSSVYVERLHAHLEALATDPPSGGGEQWVNTLPHAAVALSPEVFEAAAGMNDVLLGLKGERDWFVRWVSAELAKFEETLELRRKLVEEIPL
jgi:uncharacterized protein DUF5691